MVEATAGRFCQVVPDVEGEVVQQTQVTVENGGGFCLGSRNRFLIFGSEQWRVKLMGLWSRRNRKAGRARLLPSGAGEPSGQRLAFPGNTRRGKVSPTP